MVNMLLQRTYCVQQFTIGGDCGDWRQTLSADCMYVCVCVCVYIDSPPPYLLQLPVNVHIFSRPLSPNQTYRDRVVFFIFFFSTAPRGTYYTRYTGWCKKTRNLKLKLKNEKVFKIYQMQVGRQVVDYPSYTTTLLKIKNLTFYKNNIS